MAYRILEEKCQLLKLNHYLLSITFSVEDIVTQTHLQSGWSQPRITVLSLFEILGISIPFVIIYLFVFISIHRASPLVWVVVGIEESRLQSDVESPVLGAVQRLLDMILAISSNSIFMVTSIRYVPKKGLMVSGITEEDVHSMFEMRLLVEPYALRTYGSSIPREQLEAFAELMHHPDRITDFCESDDAFHELLMSTLPNKYLRSAYDRITGLNTRFRIMTGKVSMINQEQTCEEHLEILDAALADNWDLAADSLQHHLELARDKAEGVIKVIRLW